MGTCRLGAQRSAWPSAAPDAGARGSLFAVLLSLVSLVSLWHMQCPADLTP